MIEQIMVFVLGVLCATLLALLIMPAVWQRAVRLTTRRIEAAVPVSLFEVQADKDLLRAEFALAVRRLELQVDEMRAQIAADARAMERLRVKELESEHLRADISAAGDAIASERDAALAALEETRTALEARTAMLAEATAGLASREDEYAAVLADARARLEAEKERCAALEARLAAREEAIAALRPSPLKPDADDLEVLRTALTEVAARIVASTPGIAVPTSAPTSELAARIGALRAQELPPQPVQPAAAATDKGSDTASMAGPK